MRKFIVSTPDTRKALSVSIRTARAARFDHDATLGYASTIAINLATIEAESGNWNARRAYNQAATLLSRYESAYLN